MSREAMKLALEALEGMYIQGFTQDDSPINNAITALREALAEQPAQQEPKIDIYRSFEQWKSGNVLEHGVPRTEHYSEAQLDLVEMGWNYGHDAGRAVEQALDKMAENARELGLDYEPSAETQVSKVWWDGEKLMAKQVPLGDFYKPAPVHQEPVGKVTETIDGAFKCEFSKPLQKGALLYTTPPAQQEPVACIYKGHLYMAHEFQSGQCPIDSQPLYTSPQRTWVGLTDEERDDILDIYITAEGRARAIEHKLKEKNT